jgi:hypothetical protein
MARLHTGIVALCLFAFTCTAYAEIGTVRLMEDRLLFASPATATETPNQYVKVMCHTDEDFQSTRPTHTVTSDPIHPLVRASAGETLTILDVIRCGDPKNGAQVRVRTPQNITGYTRLPNYHTRIQTTDPEAAYQVLFLIAPPCMLTQSADPECRVPAFADPFANYARLYPTSPRVPKAAEYAAVEYKYAADTFQYIADIGGHPTLTSYATRYTRDTLIAKANEYRTLTTQMQTLANQQPAPQQTASTPSVSINDRTVHDPQFPDFRKPTQQTASTMSQSTPSAPPAALSNILPTIYYALLLLLPLAYIIIYPIRYKRITDRIPTGEVGNSIIEGIVFCLLAVAVSYLLADYLKPFVLIAFALLLYFRLEARLRPARDKHAADELKRKQETLKALTPLLNALHATYGRYGDMPECYPADWYAPRKHYIEYMADVLYTVHAKFNTFALSHHGIAADSHPLVKLHWLDFSCDELQPANVEDSRHPYNVLIRAITDPSDHDHNIFRGLIPQTADLLPYLTAERWQEPLARQAHELEMLVTQEITKQQYVIIGTPPNRDQYPLPIFYRDQRFRHTYIIGKTGSGKSTLLRNLIAQDIHYGNGLIVLSPENDLFERLLAFIPPERTDDLIYFDPTDTKPPIIGFNPLALEAGEDLTQKAGETMTALKRRPRRFGCDHGAIDPERCLRPPTTRGLCSSRTENWEVGF